MSKSKLWPKEKAPWGAKIINIVDGKQIEGDELTYCIAWGEALDECKEAVERVLDDEEIVKILKPIYINETNVLPKYSKAIITHIKKRLFKEEKRKC